MGAHTIEDAEDYELRNVRIALISMEDPDAKGGNRPTYDGNHDDSHHNGHGAVSRHRRQNLACDDKINHTIAKQNDQLQDDEKLSRVPAERVSGKNERSIAGDGSERGDISHRNGADQGTKEGAKRGISEREGKDVRSEHAEGDILSGEVNRTPEEERLKIGSPTQSLAFVRKDSLDTAGFEVVLDEGTFEVSAISGELGVAIWGALSWSDAFFRIRWTVALPILHGRPDDSLLTTIRRRRRQWHCTK